MEIEQARQMEISIRGFDASHLLPLSTNRFFRLNGKHPGGRGRLQAKRWFNHHCQCDVMSYITDFQYGGQNCCSFSYRKCGNSYYLDASFTLFDVVQESENTLLPAADVDFIARFSSTKSSSVYQKLLPLVALVVEKHFGSDTSHHI